MKNLYIKFWALVYRSTGYYNSSIDAYILDHIQDRSDAIQKMLAKEARIKNPKNRLKLSTLISLQIGLWQAKNGFTIRVGSFADSLFWFRLKIRDRVRALKRRLKK